MLWLFFLFYSGIHFSCSFKKPFFLSLALTEFHILLILFRISIMLCIFLNFLSSSPSPIKPLSLDCLFSRFSSCCWNLPPGFLVVIILDFFTHIPEAHTSVGPWSVTVGPCSIFETLDIFILLLYIYMFLYIYI